MRSSGCQALLPSAPVVTFLLCATSDISEWRLHEITMATGITPAMSAPAVGSGSVYAFTPHDITGAYLDGGKTYSVTLPAPVPARISGLLWFMITSTARCWKQTRGLRVWTARLTMSLRMRTDPTPFGSVQKHRPVRRAIGSRRCLRRASQPSFVYMVRWNHGLTIHGVLETWNWSSKASTHPWESWLCVDKGWRKLLTSLPWVGGSTIERRCSYLGVTGSDRDTSESLAAATVEATANGHRHLVGLGLTLV